MLEIIIGGVFGIGMLLGATTGGFMYFKSKREAAELFVSYDTESMMDAQEIDA